MNSKQITMRLPEQLVQQADNYAERANLPRSKVIKLALVKFFEPKRESVHQRMKHLCGIAKGSRDASTSKDYLKGLPHEK